MNNTQDITQAFTCPNFRQFVIDNFCNGKTPILQSNIENIERLELPLVTYSYSYEDESNCTATASGPEIQSLKGIEYFSNLKELIISHNKAIQEIDLNKNTNLEVLECNYNENLTRLDVSYNKQLQVLKIAGCNLQTLDVTQNKLLEVLICSNNDEITKSPDLTNNTLLKRLECEDLGLTELDISNNNLLEVIDCYKNHIKTLDTANKPNLRFLNCMQNELETLNVTNSPKLESLYCGRSKLKELDLSNNPLLKDLSCEKNQLEALDLTHNPLLEDVFMYSNKEITSVDLSKNPVLFRILVNDCSLTEIDLSNNPELQKCSLDNNKLTQIPDISHNPYLQQAKSIETSYVFSYENNLIPHLPHTIKGVGKFEYSHGNYELKTMFNNTSWFITLHVDTKQEVKKLASTVRVIWEEFPQLVKESIAFIMSEHPEEKDFLYQDGSTLEIEEDKTFRIGFDMGESPGGEEFIYVGFDQNQKMIKEVIFEYY